MQDIIIIITVYCERCNYKIFKPSLISGKQKLNSLKYKQRCIAPVSHSTGCCHGDGELAAAAVTLTQSWSRPTHCSISVRGSEKALTSNAYKKVWHRTRSVASHRDFQLARHDTLSMNLSLAV